MSFSSPNPIYLALDTSNLQTAKHLVHSLGGLIGGIKVGLEFWCSQGPKATKKLVAGHDWFLDLKLHDIPTTVFKTVQALVPLEPTFISIHSAGGVDMITAAVEAANQGLGSYRRPKILAVTSLTSFPAASYAVLVKVFTSVAHGVDGIICSSNEIAAVRKQFGPDLICMVPGIRPLGSNLDDQIRTATPREAMQAGASYIVIGRPITQSVNWVESCQKILDELN